MRRSLILLIAIALAASACGGSDSTTATTTAVVAGGGGGNSGSGGGSVASTAPTTTAAATTTIAPSTTTTTTTTQPMVDTGSREAPLEAGTAVTIGDWQVTVLSSTADATEAVLAENSFNEPPTTGRTFTTVRVAATYLGEESASPLFGFTLGAIGASGLTYDFEDDCGVAPESLPILTEVFPGGAVVGNLCWAVSDEDLGTLVLTAEEAFRFDAEVFFLDVPSEGVAFEAPISQGIVADSGESGSRTNPISVGEATLVGTWEITVLGATPDATEAVLVENPFNDPPPEGSQFYMVEIQATNRGIESETTFEALTFSAVGPAAVAYGFSVGCGVIPDRFPNDEVFAGGTVSGNLCWSVTATDAEGLLLIVDADFSVDDVRTFFQVP